MNENKFGTLIKEIRKKHNFTQKDLADKYHVTYQAVSKWENGLNMPDMSLIKEISHDYSIPLEDILDGEYKVKKNKYWLYFLIVLGLIGLILGLFLILRNSNDFEFKTISTTCQDFNISGSISYNDKKSAIYISNISYCGGDDNKKYDRIECNLYEKHSDINKLISNYEMNNLTLESFLKKVNFTIDNYSKVCKNYQDNSLYLEIKVYLDEKITLYNIPLLLKSDCS